MYKAFVDDHFLRGGVNWKKFLIPGSLVGATLAYGQSTGASDWAPMQETGLHTAASPSFAISSNSLAVNPTVPSAEFTADGVTFNIDKEPQTATISTTLSLEKGKSQIAVIDNKPSIVRYLASGMQTAVFDVEGSDYVLKVPFTKLGPSQNQEAIDKAVAAGIMNRETPAHMEGTIMAPSVSSDSSGLRKGKVVEQDLQGAVLARKVRTVQPITKELDWDQQREYFNKHQQPYVSWNGLSREQKVQNGQAAVDYMHLQAKALEKGLYNSDAHTGNIGYDSSGALKFIDSGGLQEVKGEQKNLMLSKMYVTEGYRLRNIEQLLRSIKNKHLTAEVMRAIGSWDASERSPEQNLKAYYIGALDFVKDEFLLQGSNAFDFLDTPMSWRTDSFRPIMDETIEGLTAAIKRIADAGVP